MPSEYVDTRFSSPADRVGRRSSRLGAPIAGEPASAGTDNVVGYSFLEADSTDAAASILKPYPHRGVDGNLIDVLELLAMPGT